MNVQACEIMERSTLLGMAFAFVLLNIPLFIGFAVARLIVVNMINVPVWLEPSWSLLGPI